MNLTGRGPYFLSILLCLTAPVAAQDSESKPPQDAVASIPVLTPVSIEILSELGSKISKSGDVFPLRLAAPLVVEGQELLPAGTTGMGEVVHAKKAGGSGAAGELVLAARYLNVGERRLKLRSLRIVLAGKDAIGAVDGINAAAAGAAVFVPVPLGILGFAITGRNVVVPPGTVAAAKTAEDFTIEEPLSAAAVVSPVIESSTPPPAAQR